MKVVQYIYGLRTGGAETLITNYALNFNQNLVDLTIVCHYRLNTYYENILEKANIKVIYLSDYMKLNPSDSNPLTRKINLFSATRKILNEINPDVVHFHLSVAPYILFSAIGKSYRLFLTVHNEPEVIWDGKLWSTLDYLCTKKLIKRKNLRLISLNAMMDDQLKTIFKTNNVTVVNNGIDFKKFKKNNCDKKLKDKLSISEDITVIGHIGRFSEAKNHKFIIEIFNSYYKINKNSKLVLVGVGELEDDIKIIVNSYSLENDVIFLGERHDIPSVISIFDLFIFPSLYEGLPVTLVEVQKMEIPSLISSTIKKDIILSNYIWIENLSHNSDQWAAKIDKILISKPKFESKGLDDWDINQVCNKLLRIYSAEDGVNKSDK